MADKRMFSKSVIGAGRFLKMPQSSRLLYYDLGMYADDDGVVEAFTVMRQTGANEDDLRVLASKGYVRILNEELVTYILDWKTNNTIKSDRYHPSVYANLLVQLSDGSNLVPECLQDGSSLEPQIRLGKDRLGKDRLDNNNTGEFSKIIEEYTDNKELQDTLMEFVKFRKSIKKPMTPHALELLIDKLQKTGNSDSERVEILNQSIIQGWQGIYEVKKDEQRGTNSNRGVTSPSHRTANGGNYV